MIKQILKIKTVLLLILLLAFVLPNFLAVSYDSLAETSLSQENCQSLQECQALWKKLQEEIKKLEKQIVETGKDIKSRQNQIKILKSKIEKLRLQIQQGQIMIKDLTHQIKDTTTSIEKTSLKINDSREKLAEILKAIYEEEQKSLIEILLSENNLSDFFDNLMALETLNQKNQELLKEIKRLKSNLEKQKEKLNEEKEDLVRTVKIQTLQKQESEETKEEQERIKKMSEIQYQQYLKKKKELEKRASETMKRIAQLTLPGLDVPRDPKELYQLAKWAGGAAGGVRPALILGLLEVESALGINVGQCNCAGRPVCRHPELTYKHVMSEKHWAAFETIVKELGLDINTTPVSCYVGGGKIQMGGAMGPAQFMPNTWLKYKNAVENITGVKPANPWRARDAFLAAALYLANFGANTQNSQSEIGAVTAYLCGTPTMTPRCQQAGGEWYVNKIMQKTEDWQQLINQGI